ncbi:MAG: 1-acyl-sn-glycerol-3-phosphate acyltransferase [Actinobacteria bacterium]|nr:1-acyl-sn-glycerol-3-phosphate acyltransferase [Actinomycetota bacterium]
MKRFLLARFVKATAGRLLRLAFRTRLTGAENIPCGGAILAGNHVSYLDPMLMWCACPRPVHFMAKRELWDTPIIAWALPRLWGFPVNRGEPDRAAITTATDLLNTGELVGVFPEGGRSREGRTELREAHGGAAFLALRAGVPIVPVAFVGTERAWPKGAKAPRLVRTWIAVGEPIVPEHVLPEGGRKERVAAVTTVMMERIGEVLDRSKEAAT